MVSETPQLDLCAGQLVSVPISCGSVGGKDSWLRHVSNIWLGYHPEGAKLMVASAGPRLLSAVAEKQDGNKELRIKRKATRKVRSET